MGQKSVKAVETMEIMFLVWKGISRFPYMERNIKVFHYGIHTCPIAKDFSKDKDHIERIVKENPKIKP